MTTFRSTVASFLDDLIYAQHRANKLSARLCRKYRGDSNLRFFPVPNALLTEVDLTLRFSVDPIDTSEEPARHDEAALRPTPPPRIVAADIAQEVATLVIADLRRRMSRDDPGEGQTTIASDMRRQLSTPGVRRDLMRNLAACFHAVLTRHVLAPPGPDRDDETRRALQDVLEATFGQDSDLARSVGPARVWARELAHGDIGDHATAALEAAASGSIAAPDEPSISPRIHFATQPVDIPGEHIQTARLQARLRNYTWVIVEEGESDLDQLVPES